MARARKSDGGGKRTPKGAAPATGSNELSDEDRQNLFFHHRRSYQAKLDAKKKADAELKAAAKLAKAEIGPHAVEMIKASFALETEEGEAEIKARIEREFQVAKWMAVPLGEQTDLFVDRTPAVDRATAEGLRDGKLGAPRSTGYVKGSPQFAAYDAAYYDGQKAIANWGKARDARVFDQEEADERRRDLASQKPDFGEADDAEDAGGDDPTDARTAH